MLDFMLFTIHGGRSSFKLNIPNCFIANYNDPPLIIVGTLMVKRLSCLPSKQAAGVRLPFSVSLLYLLAIVSYHSN